MMCSPVLLESISPAGRGVNLGEKECCMVFLISPILGSAALRRRVCEFVLAKKELRIAALCGEASQRYERIAAQLLGKTVLRASFTFAEDLEGVELTLGGGERLVLSGRSTRGDGLLRTVMWVRPSFDDLTEFTIDDVSGMTLFNPFVMSKYAQDNSLGVQYDPQDMEVLLLTSKDRQVLLGGHGGCTGCMEGCGVYSVRLQLFDSDSHIKFDCFPHLTFGRVRLLDRFCFRLVDEFGSRIEWITETELNSMLGRYPLDESCAAALHEYFRFMVQTWPSKPTSGDRCVTCVYVGGESSEPVGELLPATWPICDDFQKARDERVPDGPLSCWVSQAHGLPNLESCGAHVCWWIFIQNPTCDDVEATLKFASACTLMLAYHEIAVCSADVATEFQAGFVEALNSVPSATQMLFDMDSSVWFGRQSCVVGAGWSHLFSASGIPVQGAVPEEPRAGGKLSTAVEVDVIQEIISDEDAVPVGIPAEESKHIVDELWASAVERRIQADLREAPISENSARRLRLLTFSRHPQELEACILGCPPVRASIDRGLHPKPEWANGATILTQHVRPEQLDIELCPRHVIVAEEDEEVVLEWIERIPYNRRPRLKPGIGRAAVPSEISLLQDASQDRDTEACSWQSSGSISNDGSEARATPWFEVQDLPVRRTFIDCPMPSVVTPRTIRSI